MKNKTVMMHKVDYVKIDKADNGYVVYWDEKAPSVGEYDHAPMVEKKQVFLEKDVDKAFDFFKEKKMECWESKSY